MIRDREYSGGAKRDGQEGERGQRPREVAGLGDGGGERFGHRLLVQDGHEGIHAANSLGDRFLQESRIRPGAYEEPERRRGVLVEGNVYFGFRGTSRTSVGDITDDPDDLVPRPIDLETDPLEKGILSRPQDARKGLVHDCYAR